MRVLFLMNGVVVFVLFMLCNGCMVPSVLSQKSTIQKTHNSFMVPADWDYRKYYSVPQQRLESVVETYIGTPYRFGGNTRNGIDCSGLVKEVFAQVSYARMPRTSSSLFKLGRMVSKTDAKAGDLVFFRSGLFNRVNHVGIYISDGKFVHASSSKGVIYSSLDGTWYRKHFAGIKRIFR